MPRLRHLVPMALAITVATIATLAATAPAATVSPDLRLAVFPPVLSRVEAFRTIILGNALPVAETAIPGLWLIHVNPSEPADVRGALVTGIGPFVRLVSAACLTAGEKTS